MCKGAQMSMRHSNHKQTRATEAVDTGSRSGPRPASDKTTQQNEAHIPSPRTESIPSGIRQLTARKKIPIKDARIKLEKPAIPLHLGASKRFLARIN
jgi:hypothetical protein